MAYENFPASETTPQPAPPPQKNNMAQFINRRFIAGFIRHMGLYHL